MARQRFTLVVDRAPGRVTVDVEAPTLVDAVADAIAHLEFTGLTVLRADHRDWVTLADVAARVGRSRETVRRWTTGRLGPGGFPPPLNPGRDTAFYSWAEVAPWLRDRMGFDLPDDEPVLAATNLALQLRALAPRIRHAGLIRAILGGWPP